MMNRFKKCLKYPTLYGLLSVLCLWQLLSLLIDSNVVPTPYEATLKFLILFPTELWRHLLISLYRMFLALGIALLIGIPLGLLCGLHSLSDRFISPMTYILYPLPKVAFLPLFMIFFGIGDASKIILMVSIIVFQVFLAVRDGVKEIPHSLFQSMASLGLNRYEQLKHLIIPAMLPKLFSALRVSLGISIATLFFAENYATTYGIGYVVMNAWSMVDYPKMFAGIMGLSLMGLLLFKFIDLLETKCCPWTRCCGLTDLYKP